MALIEVAEPNPRALRWFGLPFSLFFLLLGAALWSRGVGVSVVHAVLGGAALVLLVYYALPGLRRGIYLGWMYAGYPFGFVIAHVIMGVVYFLVITPIGLVSRLMGRRRITRGFDPKADSYWQSRQKRDDRGAYFKQY